ncbi:cytochrome P450 [Candidatus Uabimicrobium amorphum]|uniref:Cytochrome P450 n=1 Tax=Uabimicrobium amorphum TaxID=2596890 RepID=A0A5S9IU10_UABAM|nr:cytochrome P450 [Candidatus Uabimicrobium amorphum]BBM87371.1 cytochrome P450 [Candidatus Uabimicrobium amorphum]
MKTTMDLPGPTGNWFSGSWPEFRKDMLGFFHKYTSIYGEMYQFRLFAMRFCVVNSPQLLHEIFVEKNDSFIKSWNMRQLKMAFGNGLVTSSGEFWKQQHRIVQPAFRRSKLHKYAQQMIDIIDKVVGEWQDGQSLDIHGEMVKMTLQIVSKTLFNIDTEQDVQKVKDSVDVIVKQFASITSSRIPIPFIVPTPQNLKVMKIFFQFPRSARRMIRARKERGNLDDLLSDLFRAQQELGITDKQVLDEVFTLLVVGHETTATSLTWAFYLIAKHPHVQQKIEEELQRVIGQRNIEVEDIDKLTYTSNVVRETLRLYPPLWAIGRESIEDVQIGKQLIPKGVQVLMVQHVVHRDARYFDEPQKFLPERWENGFEKKIPKYAYFPFGGGPRVCIGNHYNMIESTLILAMAIQKFRVQILEDRGTALLPSITLQPLHKVEITVQKR